jgi:hypothetical protein
MSDLPDLIAQARDARQSARALRQATRALQLVAAVACARAATAQRDAWRILARQPPGIHGPGIGDVLICGGTLRVWADLAAPISD